MVLFVLGLAALVAGGVDQPAFGVYCVTVATGPFRATRVALERASLLGYGVGAWALFGLAPVVTIAEPLGGPYGGHPALFASGVAAAIFRVWALSSAAARRWSDTGSR